ncbi:oxidoreductase [Calditrichota bacterium LG25]
MDLRNPFILAPIKLGYADQTGTINEKHIRFYVERSQYLGAITLEPLYLEKRLREIPTQIGIDSDEKIFGLKNLIHHIHQKGAKVIAHLNHPGRMANPKIPGNYFVSSTDRPCENGGAVPRAMDSEDMEQVLEIFSLAASRAEKAGFDFIELQMGHGYLLAQFISPAVNDRSDEYGGSFENRIRFPLQVLEAVQKGCNLPIIVRLSGDEMIPNGIKIQEMIALSQILQEKHVAAIHVSAGTVCSTPPWFFQHMFVPKGKTWQLARLIKREIDIPVIFVGKINRFADVDRLKTEYQAEFMAVGRALVADPLFIGKYLGQVKERFRPCLACSEGCLGGVKGGRGLHCVVNPLVGETLPEIMQTKQRKRIAVVGGGLAGMQAAITLKERGHQVDLFEKDQLGGQFNLAYLPPHKESLKEIVDYFVDEIREKGVQVVLKEVHAEDLLNGNYHLVVLATGAKPKIPPIQGLKEYFWAEFLKEENLPKHQKIVVIGGGLIGIEIASKLIDHDNEVIIVEMLEEIARGMEMIERAMTLKKLSDHQVPIYTQSKVIRIDGQQVFVSDGADFVIKNVDKIVLATGMEPYNPLEEQLKDKIPVFVVGDAREVGKAQDAIRDGFLLATKI